jgi:hypothetical protein
MKGSFRRHCKARPRYQISAEKMCPASAPK